MSDDVGTFFADGASFTLPVNIKIIERDLIFNDVGSKKVNLKIDLKNDSLQSSIYKIEVQELRNFKSKKKAIFEVTMEALVSEAYFLNVLPYLRKINNLLFNFFYCII
ncbi:MAG: hypothetical protein V1891_04780 [bacterium]